MANTEEIEVKVGMNVKSALILEEFKAKKAGFLENSISQVS